MNLKFQELLTPVSSASSFSVNSPYKSHSVFVKITKTPAFHYASLLLIVASTIFIGIDVDRDHNGQNLNVGDVYYTTDLVFTILFTVEILLRCLAYKSLFHYWNDPSCGFWNKFDILFIAIVWSESFVFPFVLTYGDEHKMRPFRIIRLLRIFRLYMDIPLLARLVRAILSSVRVVAVILSFQALVMYFVALNLVNWSRSTSGVLDANFQNTQNIFYDYFGHVYSAMATLFQFLIVDSTFAVLNDVLIESWYIGLILVIYFAVSTMLVYNLLIGGVCRAVAESSVAETEKDSARIIKRAFKRGDPFQSGQVKVVNFEVKIRPKLLRNEAIHDSAVDIAKMISAAPPDNQLTASENASEVPEPQASNEFSSDLVINTELFIETYLKLMKPLQAQDIATCLTELETFYKIVDDTLTK